MPFPFCPVNSSSTIGNALRRDFGRPLVSKLDRRNAVNKGFEAAMTAIEMANLLASLDSPGQDGVRAPGGA